MKKLILGIIITMIVLIFSMIGYLLLMKDNSKSAEIVAMEIKEPSKSEDSIITKIINNPPSLKTSTDNSNDKKQMAITGSYKSGNFIKIDPLHHAEGLVSVIKAGENYKLVFAENFKSANGPDLFVYLSSPQDFKNTAIGGVDTSKTINLGVLKSQTGTQEYLISKNDYETYGHSVIIWCKKFGIQFSRADLKNDSI